MTGWKLFIANLFLFLQMMVLRIHVMLLYQVKLQQYHVCTYDT